LVSSRIVALPDDIPDTTIFISYDGLSAYITAILEPFAKAVVVISPRKAPFALVNAVFVVALYQVKIPLLVLEGLSIEKANCKK